RDRLPRGRPCVYVANHSSYMDSLVLFAVLPGRLHFVAKKEMAGQFFAGPFLRRIGTEFVERIDKQRGLEDARRVSGAAQAGHSLVFFPEGTFTRMPGLTPFHMGAFVAAAEAGLPVVPVAIRGTRSVLRDGSWFPRWGRIAVRIAEPIAPQGSDWNAAISLRNAAREAVLRECGEPDLAPQAE
ncbi:MAG: lysophospholipid acyltransferase family protein, partial [bacterium]